MKRRPLHAIAGAVTTGYLAAMEIAITKGASDDRIAIRRADGSTAETRFPKKGPVPHDAVHYFVEREMGLTRGFWGLVAAGADPGELAELARAGGHPSSKRAAVPDAGIVELIQAERLVECFEAELWSGGADDSAMLSVARAGWAASLVAPPTIATGVVASIRVALRAFADRWIAAPQGHVAALRWE